MAIRRARIALLLFGLAFMGLGAYVAWIWLSHKQYARVIEWLIGALIVHDGIIAPTVFVVTLLGRRLGARVPAIVIAIVEGALAIGGIFTLLFLPEVIKKAIGTASSSILPQNYALHLGVFYVVLALLTAAAILFYFRVFVRRQNLRVPADQA
jgi:cytochrome bd-type quinol oxidase subunit 2